MYGLDFSVSAQLKERLALKSLCIAGLSTSQKSAISMVGLRRVDTYLIQNIS